VRPFAKTLRRLRRRLGPLRDLDVMQHHLVELREQGDAERLAAIDWIDARLVNMRRDALQQARKTASPARMLAKLGTWWGLRDEIASADNRIDALLRESLSRQFAAFSRESNRLFAAAEVASTDAPMALQPVDPHAIRIAGKSLRYTVEMAEVQGHAPAKSVTKTFKRMQDALGLWHDFIVLTERMLLISGEVKLAHHDAPTQRAILGLAQATLRRSESQLKKFADLWQTHGQSLADAIAMMGKASKSKPANTEATTAAPSQEAATPAVTESKTDHDPCDSTRTSAPAQAAPDAPEAA